MRIILPSYLLLVYIFTSTSFAQQKKCATIDLLNKRIAENPSVLEKFEEAETKIQDWRMSHEDSYKTRAVSTIPVVVHVVYNDPTFNISQNQVISQIERLNMDFRLLNEDSLQPAHPYWIYTSDTQIEFCLADTDPNGNPTNGITRTYTDSTYFTFGYPYMKFDETGGKTGWPSDKYLNLWVTVLNDTWLGFATFPSDLALDPELDGVVIRPEAFGSVGTAGTSPFIGNDLGRTATHEVGHWLFLRHIWGDNQPNCGDDLVDDTKGAYEPNFGNPSFPLKPFNGCGSGQDGEMFMNYMDYPDDAALVMFTYGQAVRMNAALGQYRLSLLSSNGCSGTAGISDVSGNIKFSLYPNPGSGKFFVDFFNEDKNTLFIYNVLGERVLQLEGISNTNNMLDLSSLPEGIYYVNIAANSKSENKKIIILK